MSEVLTRNQRLATSPKRAAIIKSAIAEFLRQGFDRASIEDIAAGAGVAKQTIYAHFSSKVGLVEAIDRECLVWPDELADLSYDPDASLKTQLTRIGRVFLTVFTSDALIVVLRIRVARWVDAPETVGPTVSSQSDLFFASLTEWVEAATQDGRLATKNTKLAASEFQTLLTAPLWQVVFTGQSMSQRQLDERLRSSVRMFLNTYEARTDSTEPTGA